MPFAPPIRIWKHVGSPFLSGKMAWIAVAASLDMVPTPSLKTRLSISTSGIKYTETLCCLRSTAKGVSEKACPILAAHRAGEVMLEKVPMALIIVK